MIFVSCNILFLGKNFRAVFVIWSHPGALFFTSISICFWIVPGVVKMDELFVTELWSVEILATTSGRFGP